MAEELWRPSLDLALHRNRQSPQVRFVQLATIRETGRPAVRTLVFRGFLGETHQLTFATDGRSVKTDDEPLPHFCLLVLEIRDVDHLELHGNPQHRWRYSKDAYGRWSGLQVNP